MSDRPCKESVSGQHNEGRKDGRCTWCRAKVYPVPRAPQKLVQPTKADVEYRRMYDPDFGDREDDV